MQIDSLRKLDYPDIDSPAVRLLPEGNAFDATFRNWPKSPDMQESESEPIDPAPPLQDSIDN